MPKTLAIRLDDDLHAAASAVAQLQGISLTELIRTSIEGYLQAQRDSGELAEKAQAVLADIDRDAEARRSAIAGLIGDGDKPPARPARGGRRKAEDT